MIELLLTLLAIWVIFGIVISIYDALTPYKR